MSLLTGTRENDLWRSVKKCVFLQLDVAYLGLSFGKNGVLI